MSTSTTTLPTTLKTANPVVSLTGIDTAHPKGSGILAWTDDSGGSVQIKGTREVLMNWVRRMRGTTTTEDNSFDATNVGPQT